jgi:hypothetical protein
MIIDLREKKESILPETKREEALRSKYHMRRKHS